MDQDRVSKFQTLINIAAYCRPKENDAYSADEFRRSLEMITQEKGTIWVLGDFNYPKLEWDKDYVPCIKMGCATPICMIVTLKLCQILTSAMLCVNLRDKVISWICS